MLDEVKFEPRNAVKFTKYIHYLVVISVLVTAAFMFVEPKDYAETVETYESISDVRNSRAYYPTQRILRYVKENSNESITGVDSVNWIILKEFDKTCPYLKIVYSTGTGEKSAYFKIANKIASYPDKSKTEVQKISKRDYGKAQSAWLTIFDKEESVASREQAYDDYAIGVILSDMGW